MAAERQKIKERFGTPLWVERNGKYRERSDKDPGSQIAQVFGKLNESLLAALSCEVEPLSKTALKGNKPNSEGTKAPLI